MSVSETPEDPCSAEDTYMSLLAPLGEPNILLDRIEINELVVRRDLLGLFSDQL